MSRQPEHAVAQVGLGARAQAGNRLPLGHQLSPPRSDGCRGSRQKSWSIAADRRGPPVDAGRAGRGSRRPRSAARPYGLDRRRPGVTGRPAAASVTGARGHRTHCVDREADPPVRLVAEDRPERSAAGTGRRDRGGSGAARPRGGGRPCRPACTARAGGSGRCRPPARPRGARATPPPDRHRGGRRARGAGSGTRPPSCSRP